MLQRERREAELLHGLDDVGHVYRVVCLHGEAAVAGCLADGVGCEPAILRTREEGVVEWDAERRLGSLLVEDADDFHRVVTRRPASADPRAAELHRASDPHRYRPADRGAGGRRHEARDVPRNDGDGAVSGFEMAPREQVAAIHGRAGLDTLRPNGRVVAPLDDHPERRVELPVHAVDVSDALELGHGVVGDRARHGGEPVRAGLERLHRDEPQVADREDRAAHVVFSSGRERDQ